MAPIRYVYFKETGWNEKALGDFRRDWLINGVLLGGPSDKESKLKIFAEIDKYFLVDDAAEQSPSLLARAMISEAVGQGALSPIKYIQQDGRVM